MTMPENDEEHWRRVEAEARSIRARDAANRQRREPESHAIERSPVDWAIAEARGTVDIVWGLILLAVAALIGLVVYVETNGHLVFIALGVGLPGVIRLLRGVYRWSVAPDPVGRE